PAAHQLHVPFDLCTHQSECALDTGLPCGGKREKIESAETYRARTQRKCLQHVRSTSHSTVKKNFDLVADGLHDLSHLGKGAARTIKLVPTMIRNDDSGAANIDRSFCVVYAHDPLQAELAVPLFDHFSDVVPVH